MISRKQFFKMLTLGGVGLWMKPGPALARWHDRGAPLTRVQRQSLVMGTIAAFDVIAPTERDGYAAIRRAVDIFRDVDAKLSMYSSTSEVAQLAQHAGKAPISTSSETASVLRFAQTMAHQTAGRFDITIEPLMRRWGFRQPPGETVTPPTDEELQQLQRVIGYEKLYVEDSTAQLARSGMAIDVGGIAGGYALDRAIAAMKRMNVAAAFINFSGDIHCFGTPADGELWTVRLLDPVTQTPRSHEIPLHNKALSTSGSYQNRRHTATGRSWGHLLAPDQAEPIEPVGSVTAIHPSAMRADAWSTAAYVGADPGDAALRIITL